MCVAQELRFQHITTEDGLSDDAITCILEARDGLIWIGTEHGLNRFDGQRTVVVGSTDVQVTSIAEDEEGVIWFSTTAPGLDRIDPSTGLVARCTPASHGLPDSGINHILPIGGHTLVLCTRAKGAVWLDTRTFKWFNRGFRFPKINERGDTVSWSHETWCHSALPIGDDRLWLPMVHGAGTYVVGSRTGELLGIMANCAPGVWDKLTNGVLVGGHIYAGGWTPGLQQIPVDRVGPSRCIPLDDEVTAVLDRGDGRLLLGTKLHGLLELDTAGSVVARHQHDGRDPSSLGNDRVRCLLKDHAGQIWVGTANGVSVFKPKVWRFRTIPLLRDDERGDLVVYRLQQDADGKVRISTSGGFFLLDTASLRTMRIVPRSADRDLETTGLFAVGPGAWYLGTETGVYRYDPVTESIVQGARDGLFSGYKQNSMFQVRSMHPASGRDQLDLAIGALGYGHIMVDPTSDDGYRNALRYPRGVQPLYLVRNSLIDGKGRCWVAAANGIARWVFNRSDTVAQASVWSKGAPTEWKIPGEDATDLLCTGDTVWVALRDAGLVRIVGDRAEVFSPPPHMPHDALGLAMDQMGDVWCTTSDGLVRFHPATREWTHLPVNDGTRFKHMSGPMLCLADGRIVCCVDSRSVLFDPKDFRSMEPLPAPQLVSVTNTWGELREADRHTLEVPYRNSDFDATLSALWTRGGAPLRFVYRLEGVDAVPRTTTAQEPVRYAGVPVGTHRLLVRVRDEFGQEGPEFPLLIITVAGPFWQQWWFFLLVLGAGAFSMYTISRFRQKQRMRLQRVRDRIARDLHDDIGSTLGSISFYSEALKRKLNDTDDAMARDVAARIGSSSREMIDQMSDIVWSVDPKNDDAGALSTRLQTFAGDMLAAKNITLRFHADAVLSERKLSAEQRRNLFLICKEVLHNTVKYADARSVTITLKSTAKALELLLADDGKGFDPANMDSYNGNGLPNMRARAEAIGAVFAIESSPGTGTRVSITVPRHMLTPRSGD